MKNFSSKLSGQIGEHLVVSELGRRGIIATPFSGNVPEIDILAYKDGKSIPIQVKSIFKGTLRTNADEYLNIEFQGNKQIILGKNKTINRDLIFIIIKYSELYGNDKFYICNKGTIQDLIYDRHSQFLKKHNGVRPKNPKSFDCSVYFDDLKKELDNWELIEKEFLR